MIITTRLKYLSINEGKNVFEGGELFSFDIELFADNDLDNPTFGPGDSKNNEITTKIKGRKRVRNEKNWKKNTRKKNRLSEKEYVNTKNEVTNKKSMKPPCPGKYRLKFNLRLTKKQKLKIHSEYWNADRSWDSKRQIVL